MKATPTAIIGLVIGIIGAALLGLFVANSSGDGGSGGATTPVLVARAEIPPGVDAVDLTPQQLAVAEVPDDVVPAAFVEDMALLDGQLTLRTIGEGEIITFSQFGRTGAVAGGFVVDDGYEAVSVEAALAPGVEGYVTPGSRVNVYATITDSRTGEARTFTQLVLGHVNVLAVTRGTLDGQAAEVTGQPAGGIVLLLEVRTEDTPLLVFAEQNGALWFSLVNDDDPPPPVVQVDLDALNPAAIEQSIRAAIELQDQRDAEREAQAADEDAAAEVPAEGTPTPGEEQ